MRIHFLGVRGSTPTPGAEFERYGGNTSCVAIGRDDGSIPIVLDAGTGVRRLRTLLGGDPFRGSLLLSHLHWDHTHGLPFSSAIDHPGSRVSVYGPSHDGRPLDDLVACAMSPPHFPISPDGLRGSWTWTSLQQGPTQIEGFEVLVREVPHKGGLTYGYRIDDGRRSVAYIPDHMPQALGDGPMGVGALHDNALSLADGVDLLIHDAQYTAAELPERGSFGHAAAEYADELGRAASAKSVMLFHHDPARTDDEIDAIVDTVGSSTTTAAREELVLRL